MEPTRLQTASGGTELSGRKTPATWPAAEMHKVKLLVLLGYQGETKNALQLALLSAQPGDNSGYYSVTFRIAPPGPTMRAGGAIRRESNRVTLPGPMRGSSLAWLQSSRAIRLAL